MCRLLFAAHQFVHFVNVIYCENKQHYKTHQSASVCLCIKQLKVTSCQRNAAKDPFPSQIVLFDSLREDGSKALFQGKKVGNIFYKNRIILFLSFSISIVLLPLRSFLRQRFGIIDFRQMPITRLQRSLPYFSEPIYELK